MGVRLFNRTTRSVSLTEAGGRFALRLQPALAEINRAVDELRDEGDSISGRIRISAMERGAILLIERCLVDFQSRHPQIELEVVVDGALIDLVAHGFDAGVRLRDQVPGDMISIALEGQASFVAAASPAYLETQPAPQRPADLVDHRCIRQRLASGDIYRWDFRDDGRPVTVAPNGPLTINNHAAIVAAAIQGAGICYVPEALVTRAIAEGRLVRLLNTFTPHFAGLSLYYPPTRLPSRAFAALTAHLRAGDQAASQPASD